ncbi:MULTISPECIES: sulfite exporter TauE/SafE family protein [Terrisporobacter]|uniref:Probable membrane transporter protein n=2 Tax=Terrisporobacter TaxID=1505652 RepID=A0A0B3VVK3_9FIRM|nr:MULTISPECIES: sulfite exporter TauE/SafE family protein [Terrisporobacter]KHS56868.1 permease [Terrisporobacter othiniensis]MCR1825146.1 sulfite exporter TauE/SafE family protein [Terrisporobacter muris]MDY3372568.1 sulfite exporter TauE/SafE family protein [Terrisporobacter othiniensis]
MLKAILGAIAVISTGFSAVYVNDFRKNRNSANNGIFKRGLIIGFITDFLDAIGVGSFATTTAILKFDKKVNVPDKLLPGTLNVAHALPMVAQALMSLTAIEIDIFTLICMIVAAVVGSWIGAGVISKLPEKKVQLTMAVALLGTAGLLVAKQLGVMPAGGDAIGLEGTKLIIGVVGNFVLGALMTAGIGLYAPCMAMVALLGMNPKAAFPIMMGSCAFVGPIACTKFVKEGAYVREVSMGITLGGIVGSVLAILFVTNLPVYWLNWLVVGVVLYTAVTMFKAALNKNNEMELENKAS